MGLLAGLIFGVVIAALTVAFEHYGPSFDQVHISLSGNGAIAAPEILVPLVISDAQLDEALGVWEDALDSALGG